MILQHTCTMKSVPQNITKEQKYTMCLSLHKVSLSNYIKNFFTAYNKLTTAHNDLMAYHNALTTLC